MKDRLAQFIAWKLPWRVVHWAVVRAASLHVDNPRQFDRRLVREVLSTTSFMIYGPKKIDVKVVRK